MTPDDDPINGEEVDSDENPTDVPENEEPELPTPTQPLHPTQWMTYRGAYPLRVRRRLSLFCR